MFQTDAKALWPADLSWDEGEVLGLFPQEEQGRPPWGLLACLRMGATEKRAAQACCWGTKGSSLATLPIRYGDPGWGLSCLCSRPAQR